tara:strand:+ start:177 stop:536 length:360 start_codon:yes stop_codon:yes gene_type:complete
MSFEHRKYHGLYFILGFIIAAMLVMLLGCEQGDTTAGVGIERCPIGNPECVDVIIIDYPPPPIACCQALTPECMAQCEGIPVDEWVDNTCGTLAIDVEYGYWDEINNEPVWLCQGEIIN